MSQDTAEAGFAGLLRELKDRSGLSYGTLSKRLHMSTSTLHRYCNGDAVPTDYAPVERLARLCKASPAELVELHRRWILADANRGRKGTAASDLTVMDEAAADATAADAPAAQASVAREATDEPPAAGNTADEPAVAGVTADGVAVTDEPAVASGEPALRKLRHPRRLVVTGIAVVAVAGAVALTANLPSRDADDGRARSAGVASATNDSKLNGKGRTGSPSPSHASPSASSSTTGRAKETAKGSGAAGASPSTTAAEPAAGTPLTVTTQPYSWETPCSQHYLIDKPPAAVGPPPVAEEATAWVAASGGVSAGEQYVTLTVQGSGKETVVLNSLAVRSAGRSAPLPWNDYTMGVGCGGGVETRSFRVDLDSARPTVVPRSGQRNFPFKVSESDPEVFYIKADTSAYDASWYLELNWSSGSRHGTVRIDNRGRPFRTSANTGRPAYEFIPGGNAWTKAQPSS
ncbi:helix-turn-helix domain-containing protein [Streptomyces sp. VMFN-G11Ma]|uniref:helix-turn-helix domain-containing protein n=1 Tax=Streptomyces sp. VMFN-G11Ma TaxID=2135609 RepID=UPI000D3D4C20|nr:helix-turn-helix transcriptional regulator [Streptomyces sp. VMFN-G11Ma]PTM86994.1 helix-turn-helix protein [Streptomyces sp. VMFN-G11Ma]